jgi:hypothetical protein
MTLDPNYPRWMFHRSLPMVIIYSEAEEAALGPEWSRTYRPGAPPFETPPPIPPQSAWAHDGSGVAGDPPPRRRRRSRKDYEHEFRQ